MNRLAHHPSLDQLTPHRNQSCVQREVAGEEHDARRGSPQAMDRRGLDLAGEVPAHPGEQRVFEVVAAGKDRESGRLGDGDDVVVREEDTEVERGFRLVPRRPVPGEFLTLDVPVMLASALLLTVVVWRQRSIGRLTGALLSAGFAAYLVALFVRA